MTVGRSAGASGGAQWSHQVRREKEGEGSGLHPGKETLREELFETLPWRQTTRAWDSSPHCLQTRRRALNSGT